LIRYVTYNGAIGLDQLAWLDRTLQAASISKERVLVFIHNPVHTDSCFNSGLVWNCEEIIRIFHKYIGTVIACFSGHDHDGGYSIDEYGIQYIVLPAPLESDVGDKTFGIINIYDDRLEIKWEGRQAKTVQSNLSWPPTTIKFLS